MSLSRPEVQRIGDDYLFSYGVGGIRFEISGITESKREGIHAWVTIRSAAGKLSWGRLKLDSDRERGSLAKSILARGAHVDFPWADALGQVAELTYEMNRQGEPTLLLWDVPAPAECSYLLDPLLPLNETTTLYGDGDAGKSLVALRMALAVAAGTPMDGVRLGSKGGPVIYLDWETNSETHARRLRRLGQAVGITESPPIHYRRCTRPIAEEIGNLQHEIAKLRAVMIIVDSLGAAAGASFGDSINDPSVGAGVMNALRGLAVTRLIIHHMTHDAVKNGGSTAPAGSRYFRNYSRCLWEMRREPITEDTARVALYNRKMNDDRRREEPLAYEIDYVKAGPITFTGFRLENDAELLSHLSLADQLGHHLSKGGKTIAALADDTGRDPSNVRKALRGSSRFVELTSGQGQTGGSYWGLAMRHISENGHGQS